MKMFSNFVDGMRCFDCPKLLLCFALRNILWATMGSRSLRNQRNIMTTTFSQILDYNSVTIHMSEKKSGCFGEPSSTLFSDDYESVTSKSMLHTFYTTFYTTLQD